jgi:hypothetical protein
MSNEDDEKEEEEEERRQWLNFNLNTKLGN